MATMTTHPTRTRPLTDSSVRRREGVTAHPMTASIVTGQVAGLITALAFMVIYALMGTNPFYPIQAVGSFVLGSSALEGFNFGALIVGVLVHQLIISLIMGLAFGVIAKNLPIATMEKALGVGLGLGVVSMVGPYFIYPAIMNALHGVDLWNIAIPLSVSWVTYLIMGASFGLYPNTASRLNRRRDRR